MCGLIVSGPIEQVAAEATVGRIHEREVFVTWVQHDTTCRRCRGWIALTTPRECMRGL
jgi:hypothetical protein